MGNKNDRVFFWGLAFFVVFLTAFCCWAVWSASKPPPAPMGTMLGAPTVTAEKPSVRSVVLPKSLYISNRILIQKGLEDAEKTYRVSQKVLVTVIQIESNFKVDARGASGEVGLMQIKPSTAKWVSEQVSIARPHQYSYEISLYDPYYNIQVGAAYLRYLLDFYTKRGFTDEALWVVVLAAYNRGPAFIEANTIMSLVGHPYVEKALTLYARSYGVSSKNLKNNEIF